MGKNYKCKDCGALVHQHILQGIDWYECTDCGWVSDECIEDIGGK